MSGIDESLVEKTTAEFSDYLATMITEEEFVPTIAIGPPGIGKTRVIQQLAKELGFHLVESILSIKEPTDVSGIPHVGLEGKYFECVPERIYYEASTEIPDGPPTIMFFDDLPVAHPQVQAAFFKVVDERKVGSIRFRDNVKIVAAGNRQGDAAYAHDIPTALANRFSWQKIKACDKAWLAWATGPARIHASVVAYIMKQGITDLSNFNPNSGEKAFASPRTWEMVSKHLNVYERKNKAVDQRDLAGLIGQGIALKFKAFIDYGREAVPIEEIIKDPEGARVPQKKELDCLYVTIVNMVYHVRDNPKTWEPFAKYVLRDEVNDDIAFYLMTEIAKIVADGLSDKDRQKAIDGGLVEKIIAHWHEHAATASQ
jgi:hypothetical protein